MSSSFPRWGRCGPACVARAALQRVVLFPLLDRVCWPLRVEGTEHLRDLRPPLLLAANHTSHLDTPLLLRALPAGLRRRLAVAAAADYFYCRATRGFLVTLLVGAFPMARRGWLRPSLAYCDELAQAGWAVLVYPEGTRSPDGRVQRFKPGIGVLTAELEVPVVPVYLAGLHGRLPRGARWPRRGPAAVRFGPPLRFAPGIAPSAVAAEVEAAVRALADEPRAA